MAVLNKIRQRSLFLILIIALALFSFVLADLFKNSDALTAKSQNIVATVNGKEITREGFLQKVEALQRQMGANATNTQIVNRVWEQEVRQAVMETQYDVLGISVEKDQMRDLLKTALATSPQFLNEAGLFDENKLNEYIANLKETSPAGYESWINYENQVAGNALQQNYFNLVKAGLTGTLTEGELAHKLEGNKVDVNYVKIAYSSIPDSLVSVSKSDISSYVKANEKIYHVDASRDIRYVKFSEVASVEDENAIKAELNTYVNGRFVDETGRKDTIPAFSSVKNNKAYVNLTAVSDIKYNDAFVFKSGLPTAVANTIFNLNEGDVYGPYKDRGYFKVSKLTAVKQISDSVKVRHILIPFVGAMRAGADVTQTEAQAKATADSVFNIVKAKRSKFVDLLELSSDKVSNEKEGVIEFAYTDGFAPEFKTFSFENKKGDIDIIKTSFGYHVIEILSQSDKHKAVQVATIARQIEPSEVTSDKVFRDASNFEINANKGDFDAIAKEHNYAVRPVNSIKVLDETIPGVGNQRPIVRWAFKDEANVGDIKRFNITGGYVIAQIVANHPQGLMTVEDATGKVLPILRKEKKAALIRARVKASTLEALATAENTTVKSANGITMATPTIAGAGREPLVVGSAFGLNEGETSSLIDGKSGVYMLKVTKVMPAVKLDNYQAAANRVEQQKLNVVSSRLYYALKEASDIEDNRAKTQIQ